MIHLCVQTVPSERAVPSRQKQQRRGRAHLVFIERAASSTGMLMEKSHISGRVRILCTIAGVPYGGQSSATGLAGPPVVSPGPGGP